MPQHIRWTFMKSSSHEFLEQLTTLPADCFERRFALQLAQLGLGRKLERNELTLLCEAALRASLCQRAINEARNGKVMPEQESERLRLEWAFMTAREILYASPGWQSLDQPTQERVEEMFLRVAVGDECLAW
jgi:hypothetical protein